MSSDSGVSDPMERPNPARIYDYLLGGNHNFAADRAVADHMSTIYPDLALAARANRAFLRRAVGWCSEQGITQFLDLGAGIPTAGSVHTVARRYHPTANVVYVDIDPVAVQQSQHLLQGDQDALAIQADVRQPDTILNNQDVRTLLDFDKPVAVLMLTLLHFLSDDEEAYRIVNTIRNALVSGSYLVISHGSRDNAPQEALAQLEALYSGSANPIRTRMKPAVERFFDGFDMVDPGLVSIPLWHPESSHDIFYDHPERSMVVAGVGKKP